MGGAVRPGAWPGVAAERVLMISFTLQHHTRLPGEEKEGCFICSSINISGLGREHGLVK